MTVVDITILLLGCAVLLVLLTGRLAIPYPAVLVVGGLAVALIPGAPRLVIQPSSALTIFLPAVLFQESSHLSLREVRRHGYSIGVVAPALVLGTCAAVTGVALLLFPGIPLAVAVVIGAVVAPADALASKATLNRLKAPRRAIVTLTGEGLVNDAVAVVIYKSAVAAAIGVEVSAGHALQGLVVSAVGGVAFGLAAGWAGARLLRAANDSVIYCLTSLALAFLIYAGAEAIGLSGALATVAGGVVCSARAAHTPAEHRLNAGIMWQIATFALNAFGFLLIGVQLPNVMADLGYYTVGQLTGYAAAVCGAILLMRLVLVFGLEGAGRLLRRSPPGARQAWRDDAIVGWSGMRGLVTLAAALGLPLTPEGSVFPYRDLTLFLAFAAILFTLVGQGLTLAPIVRSLRASAGSDDLDGRSSRIKAAEAALQTLDALGAGGKAGDAVLDPIRDEYRARIAKLQGADVTLVDVRSARRAAIEAERKALLEIAGRHDIDEHLLHELLAALDLAEVAASRRDSL